MTEKYNTEEEITQIDPDKIDFSYDDDDDVDEEMSENMEIESNSDEMVQDTKDLDGEEFSLASEEDSEIVLEDDGEDEIIFEDEEDSEIILEDDEDEFIFDDEEDSKIVLEDDEDEIIFEDDEVEENSAQLNVSDSVSNNSDNNSNVFSVDFEEDNHLTTVDEEFLEDFDEEEMEYEDILVVENDDGEEVIVEQLDGNKYQDENGEIYYLVDEELVSESDYEYLKQQENTEVVNNLEDVEDIEKAIEESTFVDEINFALRDNDGKPISTRKQGTLEVKSLNIDEIKVTKRSRMSEQDTFNLQENITRFGQLSPIHVVEYGDFYLLLDGYQRLQALKSNGSDTVIALVDTTIAPELVKYYDVMVNNTVPYKFSEIVAYAKKFQSTQPNVDLQAIEEMVGLGRGEIFKAMYIDTFKDQFPEVYNQVEANKITIEQAHKKIEKELVKEEKGEGADDNMNDLNSGALDDQLKNVDELADMKSEPDQQDVHNRRTINPVLRRTIEARDQHHCQCCGFGKNEPDLTGGFSVHHMVAVMYGGSDATTNLILVCKNCHTYIHDYENGRFKPSEDTIERNDFIKNILVLGNMLAIMKQTALKKLRTKHESTARMVDRGKMGLGKAIYKHEINLEGEKFFNNSPYDTFIEATKGLKLGGEVEGELGIPNYVDTDNENEKELQELEELK